MANTKKMKSKWEKGDRISAEWCRKVSNFMNSFSVSYGGNFEFNGKTATLECWGTNDTATYKAKKLFNLTTDDATGVSIGAGAYIIDGYGFYKTSADTISSPVSGYVMLRIDRSDMSDYEFINQVSAPNPASDNYWEIPIGEVDVTGANITIERIYVDNLIYLPSL